MAETLEELVLKLSADVSGLTAGFATVVEESKKTAEKTNATLSSMEKGFTSVKTSVIALAGAIATALGLNAIGSMISKSMEAIDVQAKLADRLGITTDELAALSLAADLAGTSIDSVTRSSTFLQRQIAAAKKGSEEAASSFLQLGIELEAFSKLSASEQIGKIADELYKIEDPARRTALAVRLLGRGAMEMDAFLRDGSEGIAEAKRQVDALGGAISRLDMKAVEEANDLWTSFRAILTRIWDELATQLAPVFSIVLTEAIACAQGIIREFGGVRQMISGMLINVGIFADGWVRTAQTIGGVLKNLGTAIEKSFNLIASAVGMVWVTWKAPMAEFIEWVGKQLAKLLLSAAELALKFDTTLGGALIDGAARVRKITKANFESASASVVKATAEAKEAWANLFNVDNSGSKAIQDMINKLQELTIAGQAASGAMKGGGGETGGVDGGGETEDPLVKYKAELQGKLDSLGIYVDEDLLKEQEFYIAQQDLLKAAREEGLLTEAQYQLAMEEMNLKHTERLNAIDQDGARKNVAIWESGWRGKAKILGDVLGSLSILMQTKNREMFEVGKAAAYASTVINTASAAMGAYNAYASIPYIGPVLGAAAAAAAIAAGAVQLSTISSTSFGGGGSAGGSFNAVAPSAGSPPGGLTQGGSGGGRSADGVTQTMQAPTEITVNVPESGMSKASLINLKEQLDALEEDGVSAYRIKFQ